MSGYFSGLSSPSVTEDTITRASSPMRNSAGQTRLPTFSTTSRSSSASGSSGRALRTMLASRWHSPPKPLSVLSWVTGTWRPARRSASRLPCTSPSSTPARIPCRPSSTPTGAASTAMAHPFCRDQRLLELQCVDQELLACDDLHVQAPAVRAGQREPGQLTLARAPPAAPGRGHLAQDELGPLHRRVLRHELERELQRRGHDLAQ